MSYAEALGTCLLAKLLHQLPFATSRVFERRHEKITGVTTDDFCNNTNSQAAISKTKPLQEFA